MQAIHVLWATPRSTSTAFEWMMRMRGDMTCLHEPFGEAWYQGEDARAPRLSADSPRKPGLTCAGVLASLRHAAAARPVFAKDMPQFTEHLWTDAFLAQFRHAFLMRHPAKVLASLQRSYQKAGDHEGFTREEIGFDAQRRLFDRLHARDGAPPLVIDSDDLLENPHEMVRAYCHAIGTPFIAAALRWEPGERSEVLWYDSDSSIWHDALNKSDGLKPQPRTAADPSRLPASMRALYDAFLAHYRHLHEHRLAISP